MELNFLNFLKWLDLETILSSSLKEQLGRETNCKARILTRPQRFIATPVDYSVRVDFRCGGKRHTERERERVRDESEAPPGEAWRWWQAFYGCLWGIMCNTVEERSPDVSAILYSPVRAHPLPLYYQTRPTLIAPSASAPYTIRACTQLLVHNSIVCESSLPPFFILCIIHDYFFIFILYIFPTFKMGMKSNLKIRIFPHRQFCEWLKIICSICSEKKWEFF